MRRDEDEITWLGATVAALFLLFIIIGSIWWQSQPCEFYRDSPAQSVPFRCFEGGGR